MSEAGDSDVQQDNAALLLWSLGAWHRQQQRYREWLASNRRKQQRLRAISKVRFALAVDFELICRQRNDD